VRIVAGTWRGRQIAAPTHGTRPTLDRARQIAFDILGPSVVGKRVLDLFAGSGALGLEALSRGGSEAVFVESSPRAAKVLRKNIQSLGAEGATQIVERPVAKALPSLAERGERFDWIFADPPYGGRDAGVLLEWMDEFGSSILQPDGGVLLEIGQRDSRPVTSRLRMIRERVVGETVLCFLSWLVTDEGNDR